MLTLQKFFFLFVCFCYLSFALPIGCGRLEPPPIPQINNSDVELQQVSIVFRHGDRIMYQDVQCWPNDTAVYECQDRHLSTPSFLESTNTSTSGRLFRKNYLPNRNFYGGNCETGQLTNKGFEQEYTTGQMYRNTYVHSGFLPSTFDPTVIYLRSDEADRCMMSLESMLGGFYPTSATSEEYVVYDINTMDAHYDNITPNSNICPIIDSYQDEFRSSPEYLSHYQQYTAPLYEKLSAALDFNVDSWDTFSQIHDCSVVHACHNQLPESLNSLYNLIMTEFDYTYHGAYNYPTGQTFAQAGIGYFLQEMTQPMLNVINNSTSGPQYKLLMYSGHDTTLLPILSAFGQWDGVWAMYASQMQFELYRSHSTGSYSIRIAYNGKNVMVPGCSSELCDWDTYYSYLQTVFPTGNC